MNLKRCVSLLTATIICAIALPIRAQFFPNFETEDYCKVFYPDLWSLEYLDCVKEREEAITRDFCKKLYPDNLFRYFDCVKGREEPLFPRNSILRPLPDSSIFKGRKEPLFPRNSILRPLPDSSIYHSNGQKAWQGHGWPIYHSNGQKAWQGHGWPIYHSNGQKAWQGSGWPCYYPNGQIQMNDCNGVTIHVGSFIYLTVTTEQAYLQVAGTIYNLLDRD